ncbi:MAG: helix-turn-helix transcriptional regulator [bacterium]|nr:helix-turn-helix transcriptional regulator [bacterium]
MEELFGKRLRAMRKRLSLTQSAIADKASVDKFTISKWETSANEPSVEMIDRLGMALAISGFDLVDGTTLCGKYVSQRLNVAEVKALELRETQRRSANIIAIREIYRLLAAYHRCFLEGHVLNSPDARSSAYFDLLKEALDSACETLGRLPEIENLRERLFTAESINAARYLYDGFLFEDYVQQWESDSLAASEALIEGLAIKFDDVSDELAIREARERYGLDRYLVHLHNHRQVQEETFSSLLEQLERGGMT